MSKYKNNRMENANILKPTTIPQLVDFLGIKFSVIDRKFTSIDNRFDAVDKKIDNLRLEVKTEIQEFRTEFRDFKKEVYVRFDDLEERVFPTPNDREDLEARVSYIEKKLKMKSGR